MIHAAPMFRYKQWTKSGWRELATALTARGLDVIATGGPGEAERRLSRRCLERRVRCAGSMGNSIGRSLRLCCRRRGSISAPTPQSPILPPRRVARRSRSMGRPIRGCGARGRSAACDEMWRAAGPIQRRGNVWLVQNALPCTPCQLEGCERRLDSYSACLDELSAARVIAAVDEALVSKRLRT